MYIVFTSPYVSKQVAMKAAALVNTGKPFFIVAQVYCMHCAHTHIYSWSNVYKQLQAFGGGEAWEREPTPGVSLAALL